MPSQIKKHVGLCSVKLSTSVGLLSVIAFFQAFRSLFFRLPKFILKSKKLKEHNQFVHLNWNVATASWSTFGGMLQPLHAWYSCHSSCSVPKHPQWYSQLAVLNLNGTASYEPYVAGPRNLDVYIVIDFYTYVEVIKNTRIFRTS